MIGGIPAEPGDYTVTVGQTEDGPITHDFDAVSFEYSDDGLRVMQGRMMVAHFRWWDSIVARTAES